MLVLGRTPLQTAKVVIVAVVMSVVAAWQVRDGLAGSTVSLVFGCLFAVWALCMAIGLVRLRKHVIISDAGMVINRLFRSAVDIPWAQLDTVHQIVYPHPVVVSWKQSPDAVTQYSGVSLRTIGEEGATALRQAIRRARPDIYDKTVPFEKSSLGASQRPPDA